MDSLPFQSRAVAGRALASRMLAEHDWHDSLILALPRGGVPVGFELARAFDAELDLMMVRKLGTPGQWEFAMGAVSSGGVCLRNDEAIRAADVSKREFAEIQQREEKELNRREWLYRKDRPFPSVRGRRVILVDDGLATGMTMLAAIRSVGRLHPLEIVVAVPVGSLDAVERVSRIADEVFCLHTPEPFLSVGISYREFTQLRDEDVCAMLNNSWAQSDGIFHHHVSE